MCRKRTYGWRARTTPTRGLDDVTRCEIGKAVLCWWCARRSDASVAAAAATVGGRTLDCTRTERSLDGDWTTPVTVGGGGRPPVPSTSRPARRRAAAHRRPRGRGPRRPMAEPRPPPPRTPPCPLTQTPPPRPNVCGVSCMCVRRFYYYTCVVRARACVCMCVTVFFSLSLVPILFSSEHTRTSPRAHAAASYTARRRLSPIYTFDKCIDGSTYMSYRQCW